MRALMQTALRHLPAPLHRVLLRLAHGLRRRWWRLARPRLHGCRVLACNPAGEVLLVRHAYGSPRWTLPGGGIHKGEDPLAAGQREFAEELGCQLCHPRIVATSLEAFHGTRNHVHTILATITDIPRPDGREIATAAFFAPGSLPPDCARNLAPMLIEALPQWLAASPSGSPATGAAD